MNIDNSLTNKFFRLFIPLTFILFSLVFGPKIFNMKGFFNRINCEDEQRISKENIFGKVIDKFIGSRNRTYLKYSYGGDTFTTERGLSDEFYSLVEIGDTIQKKSGSLEFKILRPELDTTFLINYNCD